jgi:hypothetical protein
LTQGVLHENKYHFLQRNWFMRLILSKNMQNMAQYKAKMTSRAVALLQGAFRYPEVVHTPYTPRAHARASLYTKIDEV